MKGLSLNGTQDYLALLVRRKWWILIPFIALSSAVAVLTYILPKSYVSDTLILIRPRDVPNDLVRDLIAGTTEQRLSAIEQTVLSRTNLVQVLREFDSGLVDYRRLNMDEKVLKLRSEIKVAFELEKRMGVPLPVTYFRISYQNRNPELAQKIAGKVAFLFVEQDNQAREAQVFGTTEFFTSEIAKIADQLKASDATLKELKQRRRFELPDQLETNLRTLDRLGLQKQANAEALDRYATIRLNLERQIAETQPVLPRTGVGAPNSVIGNPIEEYRKAKLKYDELSIKYTSKHPDVQNAKAELDKLKAQISPEDLALVDKGELKSDTIPNPIYQSLTAQLHEVTTEFQIRENEKKFIEAEIQKYNQRIQNAPQGEQEIADVLRQNTDLNKQYEEMKNKLAQAKLSESLESRQKGSQFVIVDPANYPLAATKPVKSTIFLAGMSISLVIGLIVALVADLLAQKVWKQSDLESMLGLTVLAEIPTIITNSDLEIARKKRLIHGISFLAIGAAYTVGLYFIYLKQAAVLRGLNPIIQKLIY